jgi:hypothetical protein
VSAEDELKGRLQRAADLVKGLPENLQGEAFNRAFESLSGTAGAGTTERVTRRRKPKETRKGTQRRQTKGAHKRSTPTRLKDLNLRPKGSQAFADFVADKQPSSDHEKKLVAVYYLTNVLEMEGVTVDHVYSCYKEMNWKIAPDLDASLRMTASKKAWLDTGDMSSIRVAIPGENHVEQDLPKGSKDQK